LQDASSRWSAEQIPSRKLRTAKQKKNKKMLYFICTDVKKIKTLKPWRDMTQNCVQSIPENCREFKIYSNCYGTPYSYQSQFHKRLKRNMYNSFTV